MSPLKKANIALTIPDGQWTPEQLIAALQDHLSQGHKLYQFLNIDNSVALIHELLVVCTDRRVIKMLNRYDRILKDGNCLTIRARRDLARVIRNHIPLKFDKQLQRDNAIQINLTESASKLPFVEAIFTHNTPLPTQLDTYPINRALCDTGSDCSLIPYKLFKEMGFRSNCLMPEPIYNIKGSTGLSKNVVLGSISLRIYVKTKKGTFGHISHKFLVCAPNLQLDNILLGLDLLSAMKAQIQCDGLQITAALHDNTNQLVTMDLFTINSTQVTAYLTNVNSITAGQSSGVFSLTNVNNSNLDECEITSHNDFLKLSFEAISLPNEGQTLAFGSAVYPLLENNTYVIPVECLSDIPAGECTLHLKQVRFSYQQELQDSKNTDLSLDSVTLPKSSEVKSEEQILSAKVHRLVANEVSESLTVEEEIDSQSLDRMAIDTTYNLKNDINLSHRNKSEVKKINSIISEFPNVWATTKYSIGTFSGFDAHIRVMDGAKAWQKERRCPQEDGIKDTMSGLIDSGVFELAEED